MGGADYERNARLHMRRNCLHDGAMTVCVNRKQHRVGVRDGFLGRLGDGNGPVARKRTGGFDPGLAAETLGRCSRWRPQDDIVAARNRESGRSQSHRTSAQDRQSHD